MPQQSRSMPDRHEVYGASMHRRGAGASVWALYDPQYATLMPVRSGPLVACRSPTLMTLNAVLFGLEETPAGAAVTVVANLSKVIEMAQRLAVYRANGFRSSGVAIANQERWKALAELVSQRSVEFRTFRNTGADRRTLDALRKRAEFEIEVGQV